MKVFVRNKMRCFILLLAIFSFSKIASAQDWEISATNIQPSACAQNGSFSIVISGNDAGNLTGIYYGVSQSTANYTVTMNTSPNFVSAPAGTHTVTVQAIYNSGTVSKDIDVKVPGSYVAPEFTAQLARNSLNCEMTGTGYGKILIAGLKGSAKPYTLTLTSTPVTYTGPTSFSISNTTDTIKNLTSGIYTMQLTDTCGTTTTAQSITVKALDINEYTTNTNMAVKPNVYRSTSGCNYFRIATPCFYSNATNTYPDWIGYDQADTPIEWAVAFTENEAGTKTAYSSTYNLVANAIHIQLPSGKTYKDYYGQQNFLKLYIKFPCGTEIETTTHNAYSYISSLYVSSATTVLCDQKYIVYLDFSESNSIVCYPLTVQVSGNAKKYTVTGPGKFNIPDTLTSLTTTRVNIKTADDNSGNSYTFQETVLPPSSLTIDYEYSVSATMDGLHNRINNIRVRRMAGSSSVNFMQGTTYALLDTLSGKGYAYSKTVTNTTTSNINFYGDTYSTSDNYYMKPGTYIFRITDDCGVYDQEIIIENKNTYVYTHDVSDTGQSCKGYFVVPRGTCMFNNIAQSIYFMVYNGPSGGYTNKMYSLGDTIFFTTQGNYKIMAKASSTSTLTYPDVNVKMATVTCSLYTLEMDGRESQGFVCVNQADDEGQIWVKANGVGPYTYSLYPTQADALANTNLMRSNTTGEFHNTAYPGLNLMRNETYWVKIEDACSQSIINAMKILDLSSTQLVTYNKSPICVGETLELYAIALPNPTYSWAGPNGFTSNLQKPSIPNITAAQAGVYTMQVSTDACGTPSSESVTIAVNELATAANITVESSLDACLGKTTTIAVSSTGVTNPVFVWYDNQGVKLQESSSTTYTTSILTGNTTYYVAVYGDNKCENESNARKEVSVTVNPLSTALANITTRDTTICLGNSVDLTKMVTITGVTTPVLHWYTSLNGDGILSSTTVSPVLAGVHTYYVSVSGEGLCEGEANSTGRAAVVVTVNDCSVPFEIWNWYDLSQIASKAEAGYTRFEVMQNIGTDASNSGDGTNGWNGTVCPYSGDSVNGWFGYEQIFARWNATTGWTPIAFDQSYNKFFTGHNYTVSGLWIDNSAADYQALFSKVENATIKDLTVELDSKGVTGQNNVASLVGYVGTNTVIDSCHAIGDVTGIEDNAGILIGSIGTLNGSDPAITASLSASSATGNVQGNIHVGGLIGYAGSMNSASDISVSKSYSKGTVNAVRMGGGLIGRTRIATISSSYSVSDITGNNDLGGFIGFVVESNVNDCYSTGYVKGQNGAGYNIGGFIATLWTAATDSRITNCFSIGYVEGTSGTNVGSFIGISNNAELTNCYYNLHSTGINIGISSKNTTTGDVTALTTAELTQELPSGFGQEWNIFAGETYPHLKWQLDRGCNHTYKVKSARYQIRSNGITGASQPYTGSCLELPNTNAGDTIVFTVVNDNAQRVYLSHDYDAHFTSDTVTVEVDAATAGDALAIGFASESDIIGVLADVETFTLHGTVFPFVYEEGNDAFNELFEVTASLYAVPSGATGDPITELHNSGYIYSSQAVHYDGSVHVENTPKYPGSISSTDNPGLPISWHYVGKTVGAIDDTPVEVDNKPEPPVGLYQFDNVEAGDYVLVLSRPGYLTRYAKITVSENTLLGHRELIPGDVDDNLEINAHDVSLLNSKKSSYPSVNYNSKYDLNADGSVDGGDISIVRGVINAHIGLYQETEEWLMQY